MEKKQMESAYTYILGCIWVYTGIKEYVGMYGYGNKGSDGFLGCINFLLKSFKKTFPNQGFWYLGPRMSDLAPESPPKLVPKLRESPGI